MRNVPGRRLALLSLLATALVALLMVSPAGGVLTSAPSITSAPANPTNSASAHFEFSSSEAGVLGFTCQLNGAGFADCSGGSADYVVGEGNHNFQVKAFDIDGDGPVESHSWTVDATAPVVTPPAPITVEAAGPGGTAASNPTVAAFLAGASADGGEPVGSNAPGTIPLAPLDLQRR